MPAPKKRIGRPPKGAPLTTNIGFKVSEEEHDLIAQACDRVKRKLSEWCRLRLVNQARKELGLLVEELPEG